MPISARLYNKGRHFRSCQPGMLLVRKQHKHGTQNPPEPVSRGAFLATGLCCNGQQQCFSFQLSENDWMTRTALPVLASRIDFLPNGPVVTRV